MAAAPRPHDLSATLQAEIRLSTLTRRPGLAPPRLQLPHWVPLAIAHLEEPIARWLGREPRVPLDGVRMSKAMMFFDAGKAVRELGFPQSPIEPAFERAVSWFIDHDYVPAHAARDLVDRRPMSDAHAASAR